MEAALRLLGKQDLPRVVSTPQALITKDNVETFAVKGDELRKVLLAQPAELTSGPARQPARPGRPRSNRLREGVIIR